MFVKSVPLFIASMSLVLVACTAIPYDQQGAGVPPEVLQTYSSTPALPVSPKANDCGPFNHDAASTSVTYENASMGIHFAVSYNEKWGYPDTSFTPYSENNGADHTAGGVAFGPPMRGDSEGAPGCDLMHSYQLTFLPPHTAEAAVQRIRREGEATGIVPDTTVQTINGLTVVRYSPPGLCDNPTLEVIGTKQNYSFTTSCGHGTQEEWDYLEGVVKSITLMK